MKVVLGVDTSCYTTSVALMRADGSLVADARRVLEVKPGGRGLSQSEMVYQHTRNLPAVFQEAIARVGERIELQSVGATVRPRPVEDSYMPAFLVGEGYGKVLALSHGAAFYPLSHQENHILAGVWSASGPDAGSFLAVHLSGGTTEVTRVDRLGDRFSVTLLGGSGDIAAGQLVDRIGVTLGLPFPAGPHLERLALQCREKPSHIPVSVENCTVSFSGPETHVRRLLDRGASPASLAAGVQHCIADALARMIRAAIATTGLHQVLMVGGVAANRYIRDYISRELGLGGTVRLFFPSPEFSPDNAVGAAFHALGQ